MGKAVLEKRGKTQYCGREKTRKPSAAAGVNLRLSNRRRFAVMADRAAHWLQLTAPEALLPTGHLYAFIGICRNL